MNWTGLGMNASQADCSHGVNKSMSRDQTGFLLLVNYHSGILHHFVSTFGREEPKSRDILE